MNSVADVWTNVLQQLKKDLSETTITTWFDELTAVDIRENTFYLHCPNDFKKRYIESLFIKNIKAALQDLFSMEFEVKILDEAGLLEFQGGAPKKNSDRFTYEDFTFETFVVGPSNKLAYAASMAVAEHPAQNYNPLLIYGDSGLGKTHLLYAIANVIRQNDPAAKIVYIKGDDFINEFIELIRAGRGSDFRAKYREADLLLVDDVQFVAGKEQVQNEFFHTFNNLYESGKQIVLTSYRPPSEMTLLDDRLRTRFEWGLLADVTLEYDAGVPENAAEQLRELLGRDTLVIQKRTKRKELADVDIAPMIRKADVTADDHNVFIDLTVQAQNPGLNPQLIEKAIVAYLPALTPDFVRVRRRRILDANGQDFR